jgi:hypothetical protein
MQAGIEPCGVKDFQSLAIAESAREAGVGLRLDHRPGVLQKN